MAGIDDKLTYQALQHFIRSAVVDFKMCFIFTL